MYIGSTVQRQNTRNKTKFKDLNISTTEEPQTARASAFSCSDTLLSACRWEIPQQRAPDALRARVLEDVD
jgi:hypothetical protein